VPELRRDPTTKDWLVIASGEHEFAVASGSRSSSPSPGLQNDDEKQCLLANLNCFPCALDDLRTDLLGSFALLVFLAGEDRFL